MSKKNGAKNGKKGLIIWGAAGGFIIVLLLVVTIVSQFVLSDLISSVLGRDRAVFKDGIDPNSLSEPSCTFSPF